MNCRKAHNLIQLAIDEELPSRDVRGVAAHLSQCADCREWQRQHVLLQSAIRQIVAADDAFLGGGHPCPPSSPLPNGIQLPAFLLRDAVEKRGGQRCPRFAVANPPPKTFPWRRVWAAAAVLAVGVGLWLAMSLLNVKRPEAMQVVRHETSPVSSPVEPVAVVTHDQQPDPRSLVFVEFEKPSDLIVIPVQTRNPNVTILRIYPAIKTAEVSAKPQGKQPS